MKKLFTILITTIAFTLGGCASVQSQQREEVSVVGKVVAVIYSSFFFAHP